MKKRIKILMMTAGMTIVSMQQCNIAVAQCDNSFYTKERTHEPDISQKVYRQGGKPVTEYTGCMEGTLKKRNVTFVHGLGGDAGSWEKPATWTAQNYKTSVDKINYSGKGWETSFYSVAKEMNQQIGSNLAFGIDQDYPTRCKYDDYVIAHSQGGIAARHLDRYWDLNYPGFGNRKFYGMVTFGTSHAGADIALSREQHYAYIGKMISTVVAGKTKELGYDITKRFHLFIGTKAIDAITKLDSFVEQQISPVIVSGLHTTTLDEMAPGSQQMDWINNHTSRLKKVAFYGVEDAPECWRVINQVVGKSASEYPLFTAVEDNDLLLKMESIRAHHVSEIEKNNARIKLLRTLDKNPITGLIFNLSKKSKLRTLLIINDHRQNAVDFLNRANTEWRYLIGSYHPDSFEYVNATKFRVTAELVLASRLVDQTVLHFSSRAEADAFSNRIKQFSSYQTKIERVTIKEKRRKFFPSDGVVLAKSQVAFPGVDPKNVNIMKGDNHFQERNSPNTKKALKDLYSGKYDVFFKLEERQ